MENTTPSSTLQEEAKPMGLISRIIGVFASPGATFHSIAREPKWILPTIILILIGIGSSVLLQPVILKQQSEKTIQQLEKRGMDSEQMDAVLEQSAKWTKIMIYPGVILGTLVLILITAGIWLFMGNTVLGGQANYKQLLSVVAYKTFIPTLGSLIKAPIMLSQETINVHFSLATFMSDASQDTFLYKFLAQIELFNIWGLIVFGIGIAAVARLEQKKVWPWLVILYLAWWAGSSALAGAFGG